MPNTPDAAVTEEMLERAIAEDVDAGDIAGANVVDVDEQLF